MHKHIILCAKLIGTCLCVCARVCACVRYVYVSAGGGSGGGAVTFAFTTSLLRPFFPLLSVLHFSLIISFTF